MTQYSWWPYLFMVVCVVVFICILVIICKGRLHQYKSRQQRRQQQAQCTITRMSDQHPLATEQGPQNSTASDLITPPYGARNGEFSFTTGGPADFSIQPPAYCEAPPKYHDLFPLKEAEDNGNLPEIYVEGVTEEQEAVSSNANGSGNQAVSSNANGNENHPVSSNGDENENNLVSRNVDNNGNESHAARYNGDGNDNHAARYNGDGNGNHAVRYNGDGNENHAVSSNRDGNENHAVSRDGDRSENWTTPS